MAQRRWQLSGVTVALVACGAALLGSAGLGVALSDAGAASPPPVSPAGCSGSTPRLTVQGTGQASGTPDVLTAVFSFSTTSGTSAGALSQNNAEVAQALGTLAAGGVARRDLQTTALSLAPQYASPHGVPVLTGYQATETLSATLRTLSSAGSTIDSVVNATGNAAQIQSLAFSFGDPTTVQDAARADAVAQARSHAEAMAASAGRALGALCSLTDDTQPSFPGSQLNYAAAPAAGDAAVPVEPGTQVQTDQVTLVYSLEGR